MLGAFIGPLCVAMLINICAFVMIMRALLAASRARSKGSGMAHDRNRQWRELRAAVSIFVVLGLGWIFGALINTGSSATSEVFQYLFTALTTLQGFAIFIFHCLLNDNVRTSLRSTAVSHPSLSLIHI